MHEYIMAIYSNLIYLFCFFSIYFFDSTNTLWFRIALWAAEKSLESGAARPRSTWPTWCTWFEHSPYRFCGGWTWWKTYTLTLDSTRILPEATLGTMVVLDTRMSSKPQQAVFLLNTCTMPHKLSLKMLAEHRGAFATLGSLFVPLSKWLTDQPSPWYQSTMEAITHPPWSATSTSHGSSSPWCIPKRYGGSPWRTGRWYHHWTHRQIPSLQRVSVPNRWLRPPRRSGC